MKNKEILKKQIIYRSMHRGSKEMDLLLGSFVKKYINKLSDSELVDLKKLLIMDDQIINRWYFKKNFEISIPNTKVFTMLMRFKF